MEAGGAGDEMDPARSSEVQIIALGPKGDGERPFALSRPRSEGIGVIRRQKLRGGLSVFLQLQVWVRNVMAKGPSASPVHTLKGAVALPGVPDVST